MKDIDIDNTIEKSDCDRKERLRAQLHARIGLTQQREPQGKTRRRGLKLKVALGVVGLCAVCLAIVLPISLRNNTPFVPSQDKYTYSSDDIVRDDLGLTIKEYSEKTGKDLLFLDWYDIADACVTKKYFLPGKEDNIIYISEDIYNGKTGDRVRIDIVNENFSVDNLDIIRDSCIESYEYNNTDIKWCYNISISRAYFEYNGYKYYVILNYPTSEDAILDIVKEIL